MTRFKKIISVVVFILFISLLISFNNTKHAIGFVYPNGNTKALIMSYDDGPIEDIKLVKLFDKNKIIGTFNLNSGYLGTTGAWAQKDADTIYQQYIPIDSMVSVYKNHEIASHSTYHKDFKNLKDEEILQEVETDIAKLNKLTKRQIKSLAYPFGNSSQHIAALLSHTGLTNARTVGDSYTFNLPDTLLLWRPTCHDSKALEMLNKYIELKSDSLTLFFVWGHAWEFKDPKRWKEINEFCQQIGNRNDIWYVGCGEFIDYQIALKKLVHLNGFIINPEENKSVWYKDQGQIKLLQPGKKIKID
jgi:peptidoglycan-N-acetylglucosamine deacetylase